MMVVVFTLITLAILYAGLMVAYLLGWMKKKHFVAQDRATPKHTFSILIPARNESQNIEKCLHAVLKQNYPQHLFEILVMDDFSDDDTMKKVKNFSGVQYHAMQNAPPEFFTETAHKKMAISYGVKNAGHEFIITLDADSDGPENWLKNFDEYLQQQPVEMLVAPVSLIFEKFTLLACFQQVDFATMQIITAANHEWQWGKMANGTNLLFSKKAFEKVNGYAGYEHLASGDDYALLAKVNQHFPGRVGYLKSKNSIVKSAVQPDWKSFLQQRIRWASKSGKFPDTPLTAQLVVVFLFNFLMLIAPFIFIKTALLNYWAMALVLKLGAEILIIQKAQQFFHLKKSIFILILLQPLHILYVVVVGFLGFSGHYQWKNRRLQ